jgi:fucose 4-O-acetylase-like acetyltransferase
MAYMFFISGLFVRDSLARRRPANFLANRACRLGVPFLISIFGVMPIAYYQTFLRYAHRAVAKNSRRSADDLVLGPAVTARGFTAG